MRKIGLVLVMCLLGACNLVTIPQINYGVESLVVTSISGPGCLVGFSRVKSYTSALYSNIEARAKSLSAGLGGGGPLEDQIEQIVASHCLLGVKTIGNPYPLPDGRKLYIVAAESSVRGATFVLTLGSIGSQSVIKLPNSSL
jgi:hypothetical protein